MNFKFPVCRVQRHLTPQRQVNMSSLDTSLQTFFDFIISLELSMLTVSVIQFQTNLERGHSLRQVFAYQSLARFSGSAREITAAPRRVFGLGSPLKLLLQLRLRNLSHFVFSIHRKFCQKLDKCTEATSNRCSSSCQILPCLGLSANGFRKCCSFSLFHLVVWSQLNHLALARLPVFFLRQRIATPWDSFAAPQRFERRDRAAAKATTGAEQGVETQSKRKKESSREGTGRRATAFESFVEFAASDAMKQAG
ncbi:hypothetical protein QBC45DRAFT_432165 [Copromyces sp. CBS 386.78]|nr:hypothetical protein QBC45DRAFT_432165 [Copromyces sp. CBS 386.78]